MFILQCYLYSFFHYWNYRKFNFILLQVVFLTLFYVFFRIIIFYTAFVLKTKCYLKVYVVNCNFVQTILRHFSYLVNSAYPANYSKSLAYSGRIIEDLLYYPESLFVTRTTTVGLYFDFKLRGPCFSDLVWVLISIFQSICSLKFLGFWQPDASPDHKLSLLHYFLLLCKMIF